MLLLERLIGEGGVKQTLMALRWAGILFILLTGCGGGGSEAEDGSGEPTVNSRGNGPAFFLPTDMAVEADGQIVVVDGALLEGEGLEAVLRVDPVTGNRSIVSDADTGSGPPFLIPMGIAIEANGQLVVTDVGWDAVFRVDPVTGDRTLAADAFKGTGPIGDPGSIVVEADGHLLVADPTLETVLRIDPVTGDRTIVTGCIDPPVFFLPCPGAVAGEGPPLSSNAYLALEPDGNLLIAWEPRLLRVDMVTGDRTLVTGCAEAMCVGDGPTLDSISSVAVETDSHLVVLSRFDQGMLRVDPVTGDRSLVSARGRGSGPLFPDISFFPGDVEVEADGNLLTLGNYGDASAPAILNAILRVDPVTGDRTLVSGQLPPR